MLRSASQATPSTLDLRDDRKIVHVRRVHRPYGSVGVVERWKEMRAQKHILRGAAALAAAAVIAPAASAYVQASSDSYGPGTSATQKYIPGVTDFPKPVAATVSTDAAGPAPIS